MKVPTFRGWLNVGGAIPINRIYKFIYMDIQCITMLYHVISHNQAIQMNISHRISSHHNMLNQSHLITQLPQVCRERIHPRRAHPLSWLPWLPEAERGRSLVHQCDCKLIHFRRMILNEFLQYPPKISEDSEDFPSIFRNPMPWPTGCP